MSTPKQPKSKRAPTVAYMPSALTARVVCDEAQHHPLAGLFVIFKLKAAPPAGSSPVDQIQRVVDSAQVRPPDPGDPPPEKSKAYRAWRAQKAEHDAWTDEAAADPASGFALGFVDEWGYLQPVHDDTNPWFETAPGVGRTPHTYKLTPGEAYVGCFLRHPDPALARALTRWLRSGRKGSTSGFDFDAWSTNWDQDLHDFTVKAAGGSTGAQGVIELPSKPDAHYVPRGSTRYGSWVLYRDMPHAECAGVSDATKEVLRDLGKLRYPIGITNEKEKSESPFHPYGGRFDGQVQAAVAKLQEDAGAQRAFKLADAMLSLLAANPDEHLPSAYLFGAELTNDATVGPRPRSYLGVVDRETAAVIEHWLARGLRKPGPVALPLTRSLHGNWMLEKGTVAYRAWSALIEAFGCPYGLHGGSSLRSVRAKVWVGAINNSIHKTGLAIDLHGGGNRWVFADWPVHYEAAWSRDQNAKGFRKLRGAIERTKKALAQREALDAVPPGTKVPKPLRQAERDAKKGKLPSAGTLRDRLGAEEQELATRLNEDDRGGKFAWKQLWRLYGHSSFDVENAKEGVAAALAAALDVYLGRAAPGATSRSLHATLRASLDPKVVQADPAAVDAWITKMIAPILAQIDGVQRLAQTSPDELVARYFRTRITQWRANFYESDGGSAGEEFTPAMGTAEFPAPRFAARSFVNMSALAWHCGLERIGPHTFEVRDNTWLDLVANGKTKVTRAPSPQAMSAFFEIHSARGLIAGKTADRLVDITADEATAKQLARGEDAIEVREGKSEVISFDHPSALDGALMRAWIDAVTQYLPWSLSPNAFARTLAGPIGAGVWLTMSASDEGRRLLDRFIGQLRLDALGSKKFLVLDAGSSMAPLATSDILEGSALATALTERLDALKAAQTAAMSAGAQRQTRESMRKSAMDWTIVVQPVFERDAVDADDVFLLPTRSVVLPYQTEASSLEWWHYQHADSGGPWGKRVEDLGYSETVLLADKEGPRSPSPKVHRGLGYTHDDTDDSSGGFNQSFPDNRDVETPFGG